MSAAHADQVLFFVFGALSGAYAATWCCYIAWRT